MTTSSTAIVTADPNQPYWDLGLQYFKEGTPAILAIQRLWAKMPPPGSLSTLATIIGALYGDTYWGVTKMSASRLSSDLQAALGINKPDCDRAAAAAFARWYGLLVRANFGDSGNQIPRTGSLTQSPDVVVNGTAPLSVERLISQWNVYIYTPKPGLKNYVYGRAQSANIQVPITAPVLRMFYSDAGFNPPPRTWIQMFTFGGQDTSPLAGMQPGPIVPGMRSASSDAFSFTPPGSGHYCLISVAGSEYFTNNPALNSGNWSSQEWITNNGAAGWHNVDVQNSTESVLKFYNQDGVPERFVFEAHCRNVPEGTIVALECSDKALTSAILSGDQKITRAHQVVSAESVVPPHHAGELKVRIGVPGGKLLPRSASVDVQMHWILPQGHPHYHQALAQLGDTVSGPLGRAVRLPMGNFTFLGAD